MKNPELQSIEKEELLNAQTQVADLLDIYLDEDIAGDNEDRRKKLSAVKTIHKIINCLIV
jgi:hypothetical protein